MENVMPASHGCNTNALASAYLVTLSVLPVLGARQDIKHGNRSLRYPYKHDTLVA